MISQDEIGFLNQQTISILCNLLYVISLNDINREVQRLQSSGEQRAKIECSHGFNSFCRADKIDQCLVHMEEIGSGEGKDRSHLTSKLTPLFDPIGSINNHYAKGWEISHDQIENFSTLLALCAGNSPVTGEFLAQRQVRRSFDVFFDLCLHKQ